MTRTKAWRLSVAAILTFGWLFLTPAYSDDPIDVAAKELADLNENLNKLNDKAETQKLIDIAQSKYNIAVSSKSNLQSKQLAYDNAVLAESTALENKNNAQSSVDAQQLIRNTAYTNKQNKYEAYNSAQIALDAHIATYGYGGNQGVSFEIYPLSRYWDGTAYISSNAGLMCQGSISSFNIWAGSGAICYANQNIVGIFRATLTVPAGINDVYFAGYTDDGFKLYVDGVLATSQWQEQGAAWSPYTRHYDTSVDKTLSLEAWWYNGGGPGSMHVGWGHSGIWTGIPAEYLSYGQGLTSEQEAERAALQLDRDTKYNQYQSSLTAYNVENDKLIQYKSNLLSATNTYDNAVDETTLTQNNLDVAQREYNTAISEMQTAITNAQISYQNQWKFEEDQRVAAQIATALANQPQPTPEPSIAPSPEPSPEQTKPVDPTPKPSSETTNKATSSPEPSVAPSPKPSPQPTDTTVSPTPQPTPSPSLPAKIVDISPEKISIKNISGLLSDLTSKDTLTKLSPEQKAAVAGTLGIKAEEIAKLAILAKSDPIVGQALEQFSDRAKQNAEAPMPYTLADATTELAAEKLLSDPLGAFTNIDLTKILNPSEWGKDMTDDQRDKAQEVIVPVIIASNLVAAAMTRRIG